MSLKYAILKCDQHPSGKPARLVNKAHALILIRRNTVEIVGKLLLRERPLLQFDPSSKIGKPTLDRCYIPEKLPSHEIPGCYFQEPDSATWREQHRMISL